jgi:hypothetical protein
MATIKPKVATKKEGSTKKQIEVVKEVVKEEPIKKADPAKEKLLASIKKKLEEKDNNFTEEELKKMYKKCRNCGEKKTLDKYYKSTAGKRGRHAICGVCFDAKNAETYKKKRAQTGKKYVPYEDVEIEE